MARSGWALECPRPGRSRPHRDHRGVTVTAAAAAPGQVTRDLARRSARGRPRVEGLCARCGTELARGLLVCPACRALVHGTTLTALAAVAARAESAGELSRALTAWRGALDLLPRVTRQHAAIAARVAALSERLDAGVLGPLGSSGGRGRGTIVSRLRVLAGASASTVGARAKLLLVGLTSVGTLVSLLVFLGLYWQFWGWPLAIGFVASLYIHEMGHVYALARYGIRASAPMFIPGLGAVVRLQQSPSSRREDARVGLAGPLWGLGAALAAYGLYLVTRAPVWAEITQAGAFLNLFNLLPVWQLDGGRGFRALSRWQRWVVVAVVALVAVVAVAVHERLLLLVLALVGAGALVQALSPRAPAEPDRGSLVTFCGLVVALAWLVGVPMAGGF